MLLALFTVALFSLLLFLPSNQNNLLTSNVVLLQNDCKNISLNYQDARNQPFPEALVCFDEIGLIKNITILNEKTENSNTNLPSNSPRNRIRR